MQTIEDLRRDTQPLIMLGKASAVTGKPLGLLISRLVDKGHPLFFKAPPEARIYCVIQGQHETALVPSTTSMSRPQKSLNRVITYIEATHFRYLLISSLEYLDLMESDTPLQLGFFGQAAFKELNENNLTVVRASEHFKK